VLSGRGTRSDLGDDVGADCPIVSGYHQDTAKACGGNTVSITAGLGPQVNRAARRPFLEWQGRDHAALHDDVIWPTPQTAKDSNMLPENVWSATTVLGAVACGFAIIRH
jgi:hypothetical protein